MKRWARPWGGWLWAAILVSGLAAESPSTWELRDGRMRLTVEPGGGVIADLRPVGAETSWLSARPTPSSVEPFGHFLCFDRWGPVTPEEKARGYDFHGEAARVPWDLLAPSTPGQLEIGTTLPRSGLTAWRRIRLAPAGGGFAIHTEVRNPTGESRPYNLVEHITLASPWADASVRIITNARHGILHRQGKPVEDVRVEWPWAIQDHARRDLREVPGQRGRFIASLRFPADAKWGYVCLQNPRSGALLAYVWPTESMPWLNLYWFSNGERVVQRAIEPGTTGLHRPMAELLKAAPVLDQPVVHWLAPAANRSFLLHGGLAVEPQDFGVLTDFRVTSAGWAAVDASGRERLLVTGPRAELPLPEREVSHQN